MTTIDTIYMGAISNLTAQKKIVEISTKLLSIKQNDKRVLFVYGILNTLNAFPRILTVQKCLDLSSTYRNHGNQCFNNMQNYEAWQYYNLSLLHAPLDSDDYSLAISNRSAVLFQLGKYTECINDIETVLSMKYPSKLKAKLLKRRNDCKDRLRVEKIISKPNEISSILDMNFPRDAIYKSASSKIEVVYSKEMGRHVIAREDIKVGEVLVSEDPYFTLLLKSQILLTCTYCLSRTANLLPCYNCCFALYCSENCKAEAFKHYHEIECPLMATLIDLEYTKLELLALRTVIKARRERDSWSSFLKLIYEADTKVGTERHGQEFVDGQWVYDSKYYTSVHSLASNVESRTISDIFQKSVTAAVFLHLLKEGTSFFKCDSSEDSLKCAARLLLHHAMTSPTNMHGISIVTQNSEGKYVDSVGLASAPYAFLSLINHSCAPNVLRMATKIDTGRTLLLALRPIKKGCQLFDNYGSHHALEPRATRQTVLKSQYRFICQCQACIEDWPQYLHMKPNNKVPHKLRKTTAEILNSSTIDMLMKGDAKTATEVYAPLCELAEQLDPYAPCIELSDVEESLKQCLEIHKGVLPYGSSCIVDWKVQPSNSVGKKV